MEFSFTQEQLMLRDSVARLLQDKYDFEKRQDIVQSSRPWSAEIWRDLESLGLTALPFPSAKGGLGGSITDISVVSELMGEHLVVEPYISSILLAGQILARIDTPIAEKVLKSLISGEKTVAFAHEEGRATPRVESVQLCARDIEQGLRLDGEKHMVLGAVQADYLLTTARASEDDGSVALILVEPDRAGVTMRAFQMIDGRSAAHITFDGVEVPRESILAKDALGIVDAAISEAVIALCSEAVGAMSALLGISIEYAATRKQFGVAIGTFQVIAHRLADMKIAYVKARSTLTYTVALAEAGKATERDVSILKGQVGKLGQFIGEAAIQIHGGLGMTDELNVGHYHKRLLVIDALFGNSDFHLRNVGQNVM